MDANIYSNISDVNELYVTFYENEKAGNSIAKDKVRIWFTLEIAVEFGLFLSSLTQFLISAASNSFPF